MAYVSLSKQGYKTLGNDTELFAAYMGACKIFAQLQAYKQLRSTVAQDAITGKSDLLTDLRNFQQGLSKRIDACSNKIRGAIGLKAVERQKSLLRGKAMKEQMLLMRGMLKPLNVEADGERDSNYSGSTYDAEFCEKIEAADKTICKSQQLVECLGMFCLNLYWAVEYLICNVPMEADEFAQWIESATFTQTPELESLDYTEMGETVNQWAQSQEFQTIMARQQESNELFPPDKVGREVKVLGVDNSRVDRPWYDSNGALMCKYCGKSGPDYHQVEDCPATYLRT